MSRMQQDAADALNALSAPGVTLGSVLPNHDFALCLSPGFFRFYGHMGVMNGLYEHGALRATHLSGSSAGALVASFYAAGMSPPQMVEPVLSITRDDFWDLGGFGGLLKGHRFQEILGRNLPVKVYEECKVPCGVTAFDIVRFRTNHITRGCIATAVRASCTFPGLFQPVVIDGTPHIDGGVFDGHGLMALPGVPPSNLIVNVVFEGAPYDYTAKMPHRFRGASLLTVIVRGVPGVQPFSMQSEGPRAYESARRAVKAALGKTRSAPITKLDGSHHFVCYVNVEEGDISPVASVAARQKHHHQHQHQHHQHDINASGVAGSSVRNKRRTAVTEVVEDKDDVLVVDLLEVSASGIKSSSKRRRSSAVPPESPSQPDPAATPSKTTTTPSKITTPTPSKLTTTTPSKITTTTPRTSSRIRDRRETSTRKKVQNKYSSNSIEDGDLSSGRESTRKAATPKRR